MNMQGQLRGGEQWLSRRRQIFWVLGLSISVLFLLLYYGAFAHFGYVSAPGGDLYNHTVYIQDLQQYGIKHFLFAYPRLFHLIVLIGMQVTGLPAIRVMLYLVPLVLLAVGWAAAFVTLQVADEGGALVTLVLSLFVSSQPTQTLYDGGFPNVISAHIWLPMMVACLIIYHRKRTWPWLLGGLIFLGLMVITHGFTLIYGIIISCAAVIYLGQRNYRLIGTFLGVLLLFFLTPFSRPLSSMIGSFIHLTAQFPWLIINGHLDNPNAILSLRDYPRNISFLIFWSSLIGLSALLYDVLKKRQGRNNYAAFLLVVWAGILLIGSQAQFLSFPVRLSRDLVAPMVILGGIGIVWLWRGGWHNWWARPLLLAFCIGLGYSHTLDRFSRVLNFEPTMQYTQADQMVVDRIGSEETASIDQNLPGTIRPTIHWLAPTVSESPTKKGAYDLDQFSKQVLSTSTFAFYEVSSATNGEVYRPYIEKEGFQQIQTFSDSVKKVVLYQRR